MGSASAASAHRPARASAPLVSSGSRCLASRAASGGAPEREAVAGEDLGERQPPAAERAQRGALPRPRGLGGQRRPGPRQAGHPHQRRSGRHRPQGPGAAQEHDGRQRRHGDDERRGAAGPCRQRADHRDPAQARSEQHGQRGGGGARRGRDVEGAGRRQPGQRRAGQGAGGERRGDAGARADPLARRRTGQTLQRAAGDRPALVVGHRQAVGERGAQVGQRAALLGAREDRAVQGAAQLEGKVAAQAPQRGQARADAPGGRRGAAAAHRVDPAERFVEDEGQRVEVGLLAHLSPGRLLGGHVGKRAHDVAGDGQRVVADHARDAEVGELGHAGPVVRLVGHDHVAGLDVAVDDAAAVGVGQGVAQRDADPQHVAIGELAVAHELGQRAPAHELGDQVEGLVVAPGLVEGDDPRVRQARRRARLALGADRHRVVVHRDALDRHGALEALVLGQPHDAEAARADLAREPVAVEHAPRVAAGAQGARGGGVRGLVGGPHRVLGSPSPGLPPRGARRRAPRARSPLHERPLPLCMTSCVPRKVRSDGHTGRFPSPTGSSCCRSSTRVTSPHECDRAPRGRAVRPPPHAAVVREPHRIARPPACARRSASARS